MSQKSVKSSELNLEKINQSVSLWLVNGSLTENVLCIKTMIINLKLGFTQTNVPITHSNLYNYGFMLINHYSHI